MRFIRTAALTVLAVLAGFGPTAAAARSTLNQRAAQAGAAFGLDLMRRLAPAGNVVLSPDSIEAAMAMVGTGASGQTARQIARGLRLRSPGAFGEVGALQRSMLSKKAGAAGDGAPVLNIADTLFLQSGFDLKAPFVANLRESFDAIPHTVDFETPAGERAINSWADEQTHGLLPQVVHELSPSTKLALVNAIYLKAEWATPFNSGSTQAGYFHNATQTISVPFMHETAPVGFGAGPGCELVELPYRDSDLALAIVLPSGQSVGKLLTRLSATSLTRMFAATRVRSVELSIPKFSIDASEVLNRPLQELGMTAAFGPAANFSRMSSAGLTISKVEHAADITVDEKGTEAAAVTVGRLEPTGPGPKSVRFTANHPFLFFLRDSRSGAILFEGRVEDPTAG